jgi:hypothetical protein
MKILTGLLCIISFYSFHSDAQYEPYELKASEALSRSVALGFYAGVTVGMEKEPCQFALTGDLGAGGVWVDAFISSKRLRLFIPDSATYRWKPHNREFLYSLCTSDRVGAICETFRTIAITETRQYMVLEKAPASFTADQLGSWSTRGEVVECELDL